MKRAWWVALLGVLLGPGAARADTTAPGYKFRELRVVIDNIDEYPNYAFYLVAWGVGDFDRPERPTRFVRSEPTRFGRSSRWHLRSVLVAVPREWAEREGRVTWETLDAGTPGVLRSDPVPLHPPGQAPIIWPVDYHLRHVRVGLTDGQLTLTPGAVEQGSYGFASWLPGLLTAAAVTGLGFWIVRRVRRRAIPATAPSTPTSPHDAPQDGRER